MVERSTFRYLELTKRHLANLFMTQPIPLLEADRCRGRQAKLRDLLGSLGLDAALFTNRGFVHALSGYWHQQPLTPVAVLINAAGGSATILPETDATTSVVVPAVDSVVTYTAFQLGTLTDTLSASLLTVAEGLLAGARQVGTDGTIVGSRAGRTYRDISPDYQRIRRKKDPDELAILRFAIAAAEATFKKARGLLSPGASEVNIFAEMLATATDVAGEPLSGWGNDFQSGSPGGLPRSRSIESGELAVYDVGVGVRGYRSDLCRTFSVGGHPTPVQSRAHERLIETFAWLEGEMGPGVACKELFDEVHRRLDGWQGCSFPHHLGHGIGLDAHEVPRLNPMRTDVLEIGDVIAVEPALYADSLRAGIRLEHDYLVTDSGVSRLSAFPLDL